MDMDMNAIVAIIAFSVSYLVGWYKTCVDESIYPISFERDNTGKWVLTVHDDDFKRGDAMAHWLRLVLFPLPDAIKIRPLKILLFIVILAFLLVEIALWPLFAYAGTKKFPRTSTHPKIAWGGENAWWRPE